MPKLNVLQSAYAGLGSKGESPTTADDYLPIRRDHALAVKCGTERRGYALVSVVVGKHSVPTTAEPAGMAARALPTLKAARASFKA